MIIDFTLLKKMGSSIDALDEYYYSLHEWFDSEQLIEQKEGYIELVENWIALKEYELKKEKNGKIE
jgi:hypothetical protein